MSTNHNRIRVADLETNQPNKILKTNQNGELEFSDASTLQTDSDNVKLTGNQIIRGEKVFSNTNGNSSLNATVSLSGEAATNFSTVNDGLALYVAGFNNKKEIARIIAIEGSATALNLYNQNGATGDFIKAIDPSNNTVLKIDKDGSITAKSFIKTGGTKEQFLMADGSVKSGNFHTESYNALDCTTEGKVLDARQGKVLKDMIDNKTVNLASDAETQINTAVSEDSKVVSRSKLFNWWQWVKSQTQTISGPWNFTNKVTLASSTKDTPSLIIPSGTLTTTPQNGAIERDENGQLWETHEGIRSKLLVGKAGIELKGEFRNNGEALAANLKAGDYYSIPVSTNGDTGYIAITKNPGYMNLEFINTNAFAALGINNISSIDDWNIFFTSKGSSHFTKVDVYQNFVTFSTNDATTIKVINLSNIQLARINLTYLSAVTDIDLSNNKLTEFNPNTIPSLLENLILTNNLLTTFNPQFLNDTLHKLHLGNNKIVNFNPTRLPSQINTLNLENNPITTTGWNTNVNWINSLKTAEGTLYAGNTTGSIDGTNTESMLKDLSWTITKTPYPFL